MTIEAKIIEDSLSEEGKRLTTFIVRYPRFIHADFMTHRVFSRNASSSRAIPTKKLITTGLRDMALPTYWGKNQPGMKAREEVTPMMRRVASSIWRMSGYMAFGFAFLMFKVGLHKQIVNRMIEPWTHISVVVTSTEWENFFNLRDHKDAQPEIQVLAKAMKEEYNRKKPKLLRKGQWHLPFILLGERDHLPIEDLKKISTARCARVSYMLHDGKNTTKEKDLALFEDLVGSEPIHASPTEHQATPDTRNEDGLWNHAVSHGNFVGFIQHRKLIEKDFEKIGETYEF